MTKYQYHLTLPNFIEKQNKPPKYVEIQPKKRTKVLIEWQMNQISQTRRDVRFPHSISNAYNKSIVKMEGGSWKGDSQTYYFAIHVKMKNVHNYDATIM